MNRIIKAFLFFIVFMLGAASAKEVKFINITDANLSYKNAYSLKKTIDEINEYNDIDFVVFGGNNTAKANIENLNIFLYLLKRVKKRTYVLLGSSDVLSGSGIDKEYYLKKVRRALAFRHSKKPNYVFKKNGYVFVVMDGSKQYFQSSNGYYSAKELAWLDKTLQKYSNDNVIILQHFPVLQTKSKWLETAKLENYWEVLKKHNNVKVIVSGHYGTKVETEFGSIKHIITEAYSKEGAYEIIDIDLDDNFIGTYLVK